MSYQHMLSEVICTAFMSAVGKFQERKPEGERKALLVVFRSPIAFGKEEGYRNVELMIYGPLNYVQVWVRDTWDVCPVEDMVEDDEGELVPQRGKKYQKDAGPWKMIGDHDSCWRDSVDTLLKDREADLDGFSSRGEGWYNTISVPVDYAAMIEQARAERGIR